MRMCPARFASDVATARARPVPSPAMQRRAESVDIVMAGTFAAWRLGTLQARALPLARELTSRGIRSAIVTVPWDMPGEAGVVDVIDGVSLTNTSATGVTSFPAAVLQQARAIRALRPQAVHVFKPKGYGGLAGKLLSGSTPLLVDSDDWEGDGGWNQAGNYSVLQRRLFDWQERNLLRDAVAVTAASQLLACRAIALRARTPHQVTWVPNGLADRWAKQLFEARKPMPVAVGLPPTIVLYSRFAEFAHDWLPRYLASLSAFLSADTSVVVRIIGGEPARDIGKANLVLDQMGYVAWNRIPELLGSSDIAIYPYADSLIARSKNSVKLLELMAAGCAVVASEVGDVPAVAGGCAVLLHRSDPEEFAESTVRLLRDPDRISRLSEAARARVLQQFSVQASADRLVTAYRQAGVTAS
ncbi:MAG TPA: glycosyltransferase [Thermomicrobiales bacterium]|nr:glycosyltransferase [Thermomicrobiales bacterium]